MTSLTMAAFRVAQAAHTDEETDECLCGQAGSAAPRCAVSVRWRSHVHAAKSLTGTDGVCYHRLGSRLRSREDQTPKDLGLEDGDSIDVVMEQVGGDGA